MTKIKAAIAGFLISPLVSALIGLLLTPMGNENDVLPHFWLLPIFYFFSTIVTLLFGVPAFLLLHSVGMIRWWSTLCVGGAIGGLVGLVLRYPSALHLDDMWSTVPIGAISAFAFWLIWRKVDQEFEC